MLNVGIRSNGGQSGARRGQVLKYFNQTQDLGVEFAKNSNCLSWIETLQGVSLKHLVDQPDLRTGNLHSICTEPFIKESRNKESGACPKVTDGQVRRVDRN